MAKDNKDFTSISDMLDELERPSLYLSIGTGSLNFEHYARSANFEGGGGGGTTTFSCVFD